MPKPLTVESVLNKGKDRAIPKKQLKRLFNLNDRELYRKIELERTEGARILSQKANGGGYYLPESKEEFNEYIGLKQREVMTDIKVIAGMLNGKSASKGKQAIKDAYKHTIKKIISIS